MSPKSKQSKMLLISIFLLRTTARLIDSIAFSFARFKVSVSSSLLPTFYFRMDLIFSRSSLLLGTLAALSSNMSAFLSTANILTK